MKRILLSIVFIAFAGFSFGQLNMEMLGQKSYSQELSDVWGYADEEGNEYALVGVNNGISIVDVTDPENPEEIYFKSGPSSIWRDIKVWGDYAYVCNESYGGVLIIDMSPLPGGEITNTTTYTGSQYSFQSAHNLYIDESGKLYVFGSSNGSGGAIMWDLTGDPMNPQEVGRFNTYYLHDGMARGDTLWGAAIYQGVLAAIDVSNPSNPQIMGTVSTPSQFTHNAWVSQDGSHVFTTDEVEGGYVAAYDVTDLSDINQTDKIRSNPFEDVIPHNAHVKDNFIVTSYYTDGVLVYDYTKPGNLTKVGHYDTSPNYSGSGFNGCWGVYPYLPSGNILASDIEEGLYVLGTDYTGVAYVEGTVTDLKTGDPLPNVEVDVLDTNVSTQTGFDGTYEIGALLSGTYDVEFSHDEHGTKVVSVEFQSGQVVEKDVELTPYAYLNGIVTDSISGDTLTDVSVSIQNTDYSTQTNAVGYYNFSVPISGTYDVEFNTEGYGAKLITVNFEGGEEIEQDVSLLPYAYAVGTVTDSLSGDPLANVEVNVLETDLMTVTDAQGNFEFEALISGIYEVEFSADDYLTKILQAEFQYGEMVEMEVELVDSVYTDIAENPDGFRFNLYPTPFTSQIKLDYQMRELRGNAHLSIIDLNGRLIKKVRLKGQQGTINFGNKLPAGVYFVKLVNGNEISAVDKIIKR
ncbi:MAG: choice-of-anchor B family protein [Bacteroidales bacterium]|nr:choice-of-anchor B family protein [Bacteroidales bacterium]